MGGVSQQSYPATLPPDRFHCLLDELPLHLIPRHALAATRLHCDEEQPLFLNPDCVICPEGQIPDALKAQRRLLSGFALEGSIAWVKDPVAGTSLPFWLGPRFEALLRDLPINEAVPPTLPEKARSVLSAATILVPADHVARRLHDWDKAVKAATPRFRERGYAPLMNLLHPFHVGALRRYYRYLIRTGRIRLGDGQSPRRYVAYNEPVARFFHHQISATLSAVAGEPLKPSYVYMASYLSGAELRKHTDREQCEFSVTLCLDFSPEPELETPWPIRLDAPGATVTVHQALGDGLAYRGTRLPHYRSLLGEDQTSTSIFFHYVPVDFAGSLD